MLDVRTRLQNCLTLTRVLKLMVDRSRRVELWQVFNRERLHCGKEFARLLLKKNMPRKMFGMQSHCRSTGSTFNNCGKEFAQLCISCSEKNKGEKRKDTSHLRLRKSFVLLPYYSALWSHIQKILFNLILLKIYIKTRKQAPWKKKKF